MSLQIPDNPAPHGYVPVPASHSEALTNARALLKELRASEAWQDAGERDEVKLTKIVDAADSYAIPVTRGETVVENATPQQVLAALTLPGMRKKWDPRLETGHAIERYTQSSFQVYSVMKSPSYFIWARDIVCMQETAYAADGQSAEMLQVSVEDEERLPEKGSYAKSRTRATVELSAWQLEKEGENTKLSYIVKVHLNGSIPTSVVQMLAVETPMCVGRVRDVFYSTGYVPYELVSNNTSGEYADHASVSVYQLFEDGDGTEATAGERKWTGQYRGTGKDTIHIAYDGARMYPAGINVELTGEGKDAVTASVDEGKKLITLEVTEDAKDKNFDVVVTPK